jgi:hypothetical protein
MKAPLLSLTVVGSILFTGVVLNMAGNGTFGASLQKFAQYVTKGYGV